MNFESSLQLNWKIYFHMCQS